MIPKASEALQKSQEPDPRDIQWDNEVRKDIEKEILEAIKFKKTHILRIGQRWSNTVAEELQALGYTIEEKHTESNGYTDSYWTRKISWETPKE